MAGLNGDNDKPLTILYHKQSFKMEERIREAQSFADRRGMTSVAFRALDDGESFVLPDDADPAKGLHADLQTVVAAARDVGVRNLILFHMSRRYEDESALDDVRSVIQKSGFGGPVVLIRGSLESPHVWKGAWTTVETPTRLDAPKDRWGGANEIAHRDIFRVRSLH